MNTAVKGTLISAAVASLLAACGGATTPDAANPGSATGSVKCSGINKCAKQGACAGADHKCAGMNSCEKKGWVKTATAEECTKKGGTVL